MKDNRRKWMWVLLGSLLAVQLYAVRELLAAFALFVLGFAVVGLCVGALYFLHKAWESGVSWAVQSKHPALLAVRRGLTAVEDWAWRPLRRPDSQPAR